MLIRLLLVLLVAGGAFWYMTNMASPETKDQIQTLIQDTKQDVEETKATLLQKKEELETKLVTLQKQVTERVEKGQDKVEEIHQNIVATKEAIEEVEASINRLNESLGIGTQDTPEPADK